MMEDMRCTRVLVQAGRAGLGRPRGYMMYSLGDTLCTSEGVQGGYVRAVSVPFIACVWMGYIVST